MHALEAPPGGTANVGPVTRRRLIASLALAALVAVLGAGLCRSSQPWLDARGEVGAREVERDDRGHCAWGSATFLQVGWWSTYVRDPSGVVREKSGPYLPVTDLPADAVYSQIHRGNAEIWRSPGLDPEAIFVVFPNHTERWPLTQAQCLE